MFKKIRHIFWLLLRNKDVSTIYKWCLDNYNKNYLLKCISFYRLEKMKRDGGCYLSHLAQVGSNLKFPHATGIVIGEGVKIGSNVTIYQQVTIGAQRLGEAKKGLYPEIGDNVTIFAGAKIVGPIKLGSNCIIGANAVVTRDVPENKTAVGIPARIL